ncbi:hypothetical protein [Bradyrhizobium erythrophlei]|jgi:hypothetical protein|uniref:hypothetical protein n=1 Tax=Bradyrhizobium erythrophlei TaxID=1437360 RepID=UPI000933E8E1|nr:hypothetical protein [Bradyrhizobium erythrophlei]
MKSATASRPSIIGSDSHDKYQFAISILQSGADCAPNSISLRDCYRFRPLLVTGPIIVAVGFLLMLRAGSSTSYWLCAFPAMTVIAVGMAGAVAPLTTAVLMSVNSCHSGAASGLNTAIARTSGLVATTLMGR